MASKDGGNVCFVESAFQAQGIALGQGKTVGGLWRQGGGLGGVYQGPVSGCASEVARGSGYKVLWGRKHQDVVRKGSPRRIPSRFCLESPLL